MVHCFPVFTSQLIISNLAYRKNYESVSIICQTRLSIRNTHPLGMEIPSRIQKHYSNGFRKLGIFVSIHPKSTIVISLLSTGVLALGILNYTILTNFNYLFAPSNCRSYHETETLLRMFPINASSNFDPIRKIEHGRFGSIIVVTKEEDTVFSESILNQIITLDKIVRSMQIEYQNETYNYSNLCAKNEKTCYRNEILNYGDAIRLIQSKEKVIKFPYYIDDDQLIYNITAMNLGGVTTDNEGNVLKAKAFRLFYQLDNSDSEKDHLAEKWEELFLKTIAVQKADNVIISRFVSTTFDVEVWRFVFEILKFGWLANLIIIVFIVLSCMTTEWVTSKPWLGICSYISVNLATVSTFGMMMAFGVPCVPVNITVPFVLLGIGLDDSFVLISAWRRTDTNESVDKRMGETYSEAALSITVTSLTNFLSFCIGLLTPFPATRIVCAYLAAGVAFDFIYQITFFGGCMVLDGHREKKRLHPITLRPVVSTEETSHRGQLYRLLFTDKIQTEEKPHIVMVWFRDYLGNWISTKWGRCVIILAFIAYIFGAGWNVTELSEGLDVTNVFPSFSYGHSYMYYHYRYFTQYPFPIQVVINATMDYSDPDVQEQVFDIVNRFHASPYVADYNYRIDWLHYYLKFIKDERTWVYRKMYNFSKPESFVHCLRYVFLQQPFAKVFRQDIIFDDDGVRISASRFVLIAKDVSNMLKERSALVNIRSIADSSPLPVIAQCVWWINHEQFLITKELTINCIAGSVIMVAVVILIFTGHLAATISGMFAMLSTEFGLIGYMAALGLRLNSLSLIILIMCVGLSIDYSSHISYAYIAAKGSYQNRIKCSLFAVGMPITQSCISSILAILVLSISDSFVVQTFLKITLMVFLFSFFHSIFVLPTLLSIWDIAIQSLKPLLNRRAEIPTKDLTEISVTKRNKNADN